MSYLFLRKTIKSQTNQLLHKSKYQKRFSGGWAYWPIRPNASWWERWPVKEYDYIPALVSDYGIVGIVWGFFIYYWIIESDEKKIERHNNWMPYRNVPNGWTPPPNWKYSQFNEDGSPKRDKLYDKWDGTDGCYESELTPRLYQVNKKYYRIPGVNPIGYDRDTRKTFEELGFND